VLGGIEISFMNSAEIEAFRRGVTLAYVSTTVREALAQVFKHYPKDTEHLTVLNPSEIASKIIINIYTHMNLPIPTMEEAMINAETIDRVGNDLISMNLVQDELFRRKQQGEQEREDNKKFTLSKKDREELR
jgi:hypothetical protein